MLPRVLVCAVILMDEKNRSVWQAAGRMVAGLVQWVSLTHRVAEEEIWDVIRILNKHV